MSSRLQQGFCLACWLAIAHGQEIQPVAGRMKAPLTFEQNIGQADSAAKFLSRDAGGALFVSPDRMTLALVTPADDKERREVHSLAMGLRGASPRAEVVGESAVATRSNYFLGSNPARWRKDVPHFERVRVKNAWPGIDALYYVTESREYEFDFVVSPKADPETIELEFRGAESVGIDPQGDLSIALGGRILQWKKPVAYQMVEGRRVEVAANYFRPVGTEGRVKFSLGSYDKNRELTIDPVIVYSTFLGGNSTDVANGLAVNAAGEAYITGRTLSIDFPVLNPVPGGAISYNQSEDVFVTKFNSAGTGILYSTYVGGMNSEAANDIVLDGAGNAYVVGRTSSRDFPTTPGAKQTVFGESTDGFAFKLGPAGNTIVYSTFLGALNYDEARSVAVDGAGHAYVVGQTDNSVGLVTVPGGFQFQAGGGTDGFLVKLHPVSGATVYETYWGSDNFDLLRDVAVTPANEAILAGYTCTNHARVPMTTANTPAVFRPVKGDSCEAVITKVGADGASRIWATYFGGNGGFTDVFGLELDGSGDIYFAGITNSANLPTTPGAPQPTPSASQIVQNDGYIAKLNSSGTALLYATYLRGLSEDRVNRIVVHNGHATVIGYTHSPDFPRAGSLAGQYSGGPRHLNYSTDGGGSWQHYSSVTGFMGNASTVRALTTIPGTTTVFAATNANNQILKSLDGGMTWQVYSTPAGLINAISVAASSPSTIYAATGSGVLKSTNGGETWVSVNSGITELNLTAIAVSSTDPNRVVAGTTFSSSAPMYLSTNGGTTWGPYNAGLTSLSVQKLLPDPADGTRFYAATSAGFFTATPNFWYRATALTSTVTDIGSDGGGGTLYAALGSALWRSTDRGVTWTLQSNIKVGIRGIAVDPANANTLYLTTAARGIAKSTNGGVTVTPSGLEYSNALSRTIAVSSDGRVHLGLDNLADVFVTQLNETGTAFTFSSLLGGPDWDTGQGIAADSAGNLYVTGEAGSRTFPTTSGAFRRFGLGAEAFLAKIGPGSAPCSLAANVDIPIFSSGGGVASVGVNAPPGCEWTATTAADWLFLQRPAGNSVGAGGFYVIVVDNFSATNRSATINLSGPAGSTSISLTQLSGASCPMFTNMGGSTLPPSGESYSFSIVTVPGCPWSLVEAPNWITVSPTSGSGSATINVTVAANPHPSSRFFNLNFGGFGHSVSQNSACVYVISPTTFAGLPAGGDATFDVFAPAGCPWGVTSSPSWVVLKGSGKGSGNGSFQVSLLPNYGGARSGSVNMNTRSTTISQAAATCTYSLSATSATGQPREGGPLTVDIVTSPGCVWNARSNLPWVRIEGADGLTGRVGTGPTTLNLFVLGNPDRGTRSGNITIAGINFNVGQNTGSPVLANTAFVQNLYLDLLGRNPEVGGLSFWAGQLENGSATRAQVAGAYFDAPEFGDTAQFVINIYLGLLGRDPDFGGWQDWLNQLRTGGSRLAVVTSIAAAPEVAAIYDPLTFPAFIERLYLNLLGRAATPADIAFWTASGLSRPQIMLQFLESAEFRDRFRRRALANACYLGFLRRSGEPGGLDFWAGFTGPPADLVRSFIESEEYLARPFVAR